MDKNTAIISHIIEHIENVFTAKKRFGDDFSVFVSDKDYFNSICMSLMQIGELAHHLPTKFKIENASIPWKNIVGLRNVVVHGYGQLDAEIVWATVAEDMPQLYEKCKEIISHVPD